MLFEGPILEEVLSEARLCFGAEVEIEAANRVRRGGMLGVFASEWYEVWARPSAALIANPALALLDEEETPDSFQEVVRNAIADRRLGGDPGPDTPAETFDSALDDFFGGGGSPESAPTRELVGVGVAAAGSSAASSSMAEPAVSPPPASNPATAVTSAPLLAPELVAIADTVEPLAMLDLDIPLGSIDGRPATADLLAAVWLENRRRG